MRHTIPKTKEMMIRMTDSIVTTLKKRHVTKVQRKVGESNMTPHPTIYKQDRTKNTTIGILSSLRTANQPYDTSTLETVG